MAPTLRHSKDVAAVIGLVLFAAAIIKLPVPMGHGRALAVGLFQSGILIIFAVALWKINKWVGLFLVLATVSKTYPLLSLESQSALVCVMFGLAFYFFVYHYGDKEQLMDVMCVIGFANFLAVFVQFFKIPSVFTHNVVGLTYNPNECSAMFALCFSAFMRDGEFKIFNTSLPYKAYLPIPILGLCMTPSFGGVAAVTMGMIFYGIMINTWLIVVVIIGAGLFWLFGDAPGAIERWVVWKNSIRLYWENNWFWGFGLGHWKVVSKKLVQMNYQLLPGNTLEWTRTHNTFINGLVEMGVLFPVIVGGYLISQIKKYKNVIPMMALIIILVCCSTNSMFRMNAVNGMIAITWLAILQKEETS